MTDAPSPRDTNGDGRMGVPEPSMPPGMPGWVKVLGLLVLALVLLFIILQVTGVGGQHSPGRHMSLALVSGVRLSV